MPEILTPSPMPLVKWAGGKRSILPQLQALMPANVHPGFDGRLVEPFVGGAAMFLYLQPREALLADLNEDLVGLYLAVRDECDSLKDALDALDALPYTAEAYYAVRASEPESRVERAARLVFLNKWGWNGLYRVNRQGKFNVPFGRTSSGQRPILYDRDNLAAVSRLLQRAEIIVAPFEQTLERVRPGDFVYMDPPYHPVSPTSGFTSYTQSSFSLDDQARLRDAVIQAHVRTGGRAMLMLSNSTAPELVSLYAGRPELTLNTVAAYRAISAKPSSRGGTAELVVTNWDPGVAETT